MIIGCCGSGKTTLAKRLAYKIKYTAHSFRLFFIGEIIGRKHHRKNLMIC